MAGKPTHMWALFDADVETSSERLVLLALVTHAQKYGVAWPSQARLARLTKLHRSTVNRALASLERRGLIHRKIDGQQEGQSVRWGFRDAEAVPMPRAAEPVDFQDRADLAKRRLRAAVRAGKIAG